MTVLLLVIFMQGGVPNLVNFPMDDMDECIFVMGKVRGTREFPRNASFVCVELAPQGDPA